MNDLAPEIETLYCLPVPSRLCGMDRGALTDYEISSPGLGYSVAYGSQTGKVTLYVYDGGHKDVPLDLRSDVARARFTNEISEILAMAGAEGGSISLRQTFEWTTLEDAGPDFLGALFNVVGSQATQSSGYLLGSKNGKYIKLRVSSSLDSKAFDPWFMAIGREYVGLLWPERVEQDKRNNFNSLMLSAEQGDARAQLQLAEKLLEGNGIERDVHRRTSGPCARRYRDSTSRSTTLVFRSPPVTGSRRMQLKQRSGIALRRRRDSARVVEEALA